MVYWGMTTEEIIKNYQPPQAALEAIRQAKITLLVGISGAGKDTIKRELLRQGDFYDIVSHTTRAPRRNEGEMEQPGVDYNFIDEDEARRMLDDGEFIEAKYVHGTIYGTSIAEVKKASAQGVAITDVDVQGVTEYKAVSQGVVAVFVVPPSYEVWIGRLRQRYATEEEFLDEWPKRRSSAIKELTHALEVPYYHFVINDDLERAVRVVDEMASRPDSFNRHDDEARLAARDLLEVIKDK